MTSTTISEEYSWKWDPQATLDADSFEPTDQVPTRLLVELDRLYTKFNKEITVTLLTVGLVVSQQTETVAQNLAQNLDMQNDINLLFINLKNWPYMMLFIGCIIFLGTLLYTKQPMQNKFEDGWKNGGRKLATRTTYVTGVPTAIGAVWFWFNARWIDFHQMLKNYADRRSLDSVIDSILGYGKNAINKASPAFSEAMDSHDVDDLWAGIRTLMNNLSIPITIIIFLLVASKMSGKKMIHPKRLATIISLLFVVTFSVDVFYHWSDLPLLKDRESHLPAHQRTQSNDDTGKNPEGDKPLTPSEAETWNIPSTIIDLSPQDFQNPNPERINYYAGQYAELTFDKLGLPESKRDLYTAQIAKVIREAVRHQNYSIEVFYGHPFDNTSIQAQFRVEINYND